MFYFIKILCRFTLFILVVHTSNFGQDITKVLIFNFKDISEVPHNYDELHNSLRNEIEKNLNYSKELIFKASVFDTSNSVYKDSIPNFSGRPSTAIIDTVVNNLKGEIDFILLGTFQYDEYDEVTFDGYLFDVKSGIEVYRFRVDEYAKNKSSQDIANDLANDVQKKLEFHFVGRIRIGVLPFKATDKNNNQKYASLEESMPSMLISFLSGSGRFKLIETKLDNENYSLNYIVKGEYFKMGEKLRVDVRCVGTTGEILHSDGFNLDELDLNSLSSSLQELAAKMSPIIEKDFSKHLIETKSLAVVAFPPSPLNRRTTLKSNHIRKTLANKFRFIKDLRVKDNEERIENYLIKEEGEFRICTDLGVGNLLAIQIEEFEDESMMIYYDLFSMDKPTLKLLSDSKYVDNNSIDSNLNHIIFEATHALKINSSVNDTSRNENIEKILVPKYLKRWTVGIYGSNIIRAERSIYLNDGLGDYWEAFLTYHLNDRSKLEFQLGYDPGKKSKADSGEETRVSSLRLGGIFKYEFVRLLKIGFYGGAGLSYIWLYRGFENKQGVTEELGTGSPGFTFLVGVEIKITNIGLSLFMEPRYVWKRGIDPRVTSTGYVFPGGRLGGFYFSIGAGYNFNF